MGDTVHKRVPNFASAETELLTTLVKRYAKVLENKKTDVVNNQMKDETWSRLADDFNSTSGVYQRNAKTLRAKYENMKKTLKRKYGDHRRSLYRTGGGPPQDMLNLTQGEEIIMELAGPSVEGLPARFDSDMIPECKSPLPVISEASTTECATPLKNSHTIDISDEMEVKSKQHLVKGAVATPEPEVNVGSTPNRFLLKRKQSKSLTRRNPESFTSTMGNYSELSKRKQDLVDAQIRSVEEKLKQEKIEHELRCAHLQEKMKQDSIEHELRCKSIMLDIQKKQEINKQN